MIIAVNKCPQNITLKAFNLSPEIYIYYLCFNFPKNGWVWRWVSTCLLAWFIPPHKNYLLGIYKVLIQNWY